MKRPPLTPDQYGEFRRLVLSGWSDVKVARYFGIGETSVGRWRKKLGITRNPIDRRKPLNDQLLVALWGKVLMDELASRLNCCVETAQKRARELGLPAVPTRRSREPLDALELEQFVQLARDRRFRLKDVCAVFNLSARQSQRIRRRYNLLRPMGNARGNTRGKPWPHLPPAVQRFNWAQLKAWRCWRCDSRLVKPDPVTNPEGRCPSCGGWPGAKGGPQ